MERRFISVNEAINLLPEGDTIHTFYNSGLALLGADWERQDVIDKLAKSDKIEITGDLARSMNHGLAAYNDNIEYQSDILFIETDKEKLDKFDPEENEENNCANNREISHDSQTIIQEDENEELGEWIITNILGHFAVECSNCGFPDGSSSYKFCPMCGERKRIKKHE